MTKSILERIDKHTHVSKDRLILCPPFPNFIKIELTSYCNYKCSFCYHSKSSRSKGNIKKEFLFRILLEAKSINVQEIEMSLLGEPFLLKELPEYIRFAKKEAKIPYIFISTNGSLCSEDNLKNVISAGLDSIKFSVNAASKERYEKMHGIDAFEKVINNIKWLDSYKKKNNIFSLRTCVSCIFDEDHKKELKDFKKMISYYVDDFYFLPLYNQAGFVQNKNAVRGKPGRFENMAYPIPCWVLFNSANITWDGYLTACCFDHDKKFEITDLNKTSLLKAWHHPKFINLRRQHLSRDLYNSLCSKCLDCQSLSKKILNKIENLKKK